MTVIASSLAWITDPFDPGGASIQCGTRRASAATNAHDGEIRVFAGNRTQIVKYDSETTDMPITFVACNADQLAQIEAWKGRTLLLRTIDGRRYYGGYLTLGETVYVRLGLWDLDSTFSRITYTDEIG